MWFDSRLGEGGRKRLRVNTKGVVVWITGENGGLNHHEVFLRGPGNFSINLIK